MDNLIIRKVDEKDLEAVYEMECELSGKIHDKEIFTKHFNNQLLDTNIFNIVVENNKEVVGFISLHLRELLHNPGKSGEIEALFVKENFRSKGIGKELMNYVKKIAHEHGAVKIGVSSRIFRKRAHEFYKREGFEHTHYRFTLKDF